MRPALGRSCGGSRAPPDTLVAVGTEWVVESIVEFVVCQLSLDWPRDEGLASDRKKLAPLEVAGGDGLMRLVMKTSRVWHWPAHRWTRPGEDRWAGPV